MAVTRPVNLQVPFAVSGSKNTIPVPSQIGVVNGAASFTDGFPPLTMTPIAGGGVPPSGLDFNGIFNILSQHTAFMNAGGVYRFDATLAAAVGGYPVGFVLQDDAGLNSYLNILAANSTNFNTTPASIGVSWIPYAGQAATQGAASTVGATSGTADAIIGTFTPVLAVAVNGASLFVRASTANLTTTPTFTPNTGVIAPAIIVKGSNLALAPGDIAGAAHWLELQWDSVLTKWVLQNPANGISSASGRHVMLVGSGNWTVPVGITQIWVDACAGGGGGGGAFNGANTAGGGGAGGVAVKSQLFSVTPGAVAAYSVGAGGVAGLGSIPSMGGAGGATTVTGALALSITGGAGGVGATAGTSGAGGAVTGAGASPGAFGMTAIPVGGAGGGGIWGSVSLNSSQGVGATGANFGAGGAGGTSTGVAGNNGGAGGVGMLVINW